MEGNQDIHHNKDMDNNNQDMDLNKDMDNKDMANNKVILLNKVMVKVDIKQRFIIYSDNGIKLNKSFN
jgi:hypothetical protein